MQLKKVSADGVFLRSRIREFVTAAFIFVDKGIHRLPAASRLLSAVFSSATRPSIESVVISFPPLLHLSSDYSLLL